MMPLNRLTQFLAATSPAAPVEPLAGAPHFAVVSFEPKEWWPSHLEDAPAKLEYSESTYRGRHVALQTALAEMRAFNASQNTWPPAEWSTVAFVEMGPPRDLLERFARTLTPFRYCILDLRPTGEWQPESLVDVPPGTWCDELSFASLPRCRNLECVVRRVAQRNRRYHERKDKTGFGRKWRVAIALEHDPIHTACVFDGGRFTGTLSAHSALRFHVVDHAWPGVADALKGGGL